MIVLDEQLKHSNVQEEIGQWYQGRVVNVTTLRPGTVIKDDAIPQLLRQVIAPTFVTINVTDFWQQIEAEPAFCITCFPLTDDRVAEIAGLLRRLFRLPHFRTKQARCGKVIRVSHQQIQDYQARSHQRYTVAWSA